MKRIDFFVFVIIVSIFFSDCSTVLNTTTQELEIKSTPQNAKITIDGKKFGLTPQIVNIDRGSNHVVKLELDGYETYETQITRKISFWFWGNVLNGFIPGMITDMFTGAMYNLHPENISIELMPAKPEKSTKK